jgi:ZIP family zinc transporter
MGIIAGIMIYIAFDELLPAAHKYGRGHHVEIAGIVFGMVIIAISLNLLK